MQKHVIRLLHLSDLHERVELDWMDKKRKEKISSSRWNRTRVLGKSFFETLNQLRSKNIDIVCFTGDIADWGLKEEYERAKKRIDEILKFVNVPYHRFFLVPGNHDVRRNISKNKWKKLREYAVKNPSGISEWLAQRDVPFGVNDNWPTNVLKRSSNFWDWVSEDLNLKDLLPCNNKHRLLGYSYSPKIDSVPFPVRIIGLDSAWLSGDDNDIGKIMLTDNQVGILTTDEGGNAYEGFRVALLHHPLSSLLDGNKCKKILSENVDLVMHGHQHEPTAKEENEPGHYCRYLAAGSLYVEDEKDSWMNSFQLIEATLTDQGKPLQYDISFYSWSVEGHWYPCGAIYQDAPHGHLIWPTPLGAELNGLQENKIRSLDQPNTSIPITLTEDYSTVDDSTNLSNELQQDQGLTRWKNPKDKTILFKFPSSKFIMGSDLNQLKRLGFDSNLNTPDETLSHNVKLDEFWFARTPITNKQYKHFCEETGWTLPNRINDPKFGDPDFPVIGVSWLDAEAYLEWAGLRFPTEAEWERVAAGTNGRLFPWGSELPKREHANFGAFLPGTTPVTQFPKGATPDGIFDMAGNILEWCLDDTREYDLIGCENPTGSLDTDMRAIRGGSLRRAENHLRSTYRERRQLNSTWGSTGIRAAL